MRPDDPSKLRIRLTRDMAESLAEHFERFAADGVVTLEVNATGIWFIDGASGGVRFLGQADPTPAQLARMRARLH